MFMYNGNKIDIRLPLTIGEGSAAITHPAGSLENEGLRAELGIIEVADQERPDDRRFFVHDNNDGTFSTEPRPRDQVTAPMWEKIKAKRDGLQSGGVKVSAKWYHSDVESRIKYIGLKDQARDLLAAGQPDSTRLQKLGQDVKWKTMDGSFVFLTVKHAFDLVEAVGDLDAKAFGAAEVHKATMANAENPFEYDYSAGWPQVYTDTLAQE